LPAGHAAFRAVHPLKPAVHRTPLAAHGAGS